jgi:hypothetical protein
VCDVGQILASVREDCNAETSLASNSPRIWEGREKHARTWYFVLDGVANEKERLAKREGVGGAYVTAGAGYSSGCSIGIELL